MEERNQNDILQLILENQIRAESKIDEKLSNLENRLEEKMDKKILSLENKMDKKFSNLESKVDDNIKETRHLSQRIAVIEQENHDNYTALFDAFELNSENIKEIKQDIKKIYTILERHDERIFYLETKVNNQ